MCFEFEAKHERDFYQSVSAAPGAAARLHVQIRVTLASPLMNWTSTREYLEVSNVFVWYKSNGSVCWLSSESNLIMNVFVTFAFR